MSQRMPVDAALSQLREVTAILRELGNAGPRNQSFKQWRQVTVTLLQRIWAADQSRAAHFRSIPFSPASMRTDPATARAQFERGCEEATAYLETLARELEDSVSRPAGTLVRPPAVEERPLAEGPRAPEPPLEPGLPPVEPDWTVSPVAPTGDPTPFAAEAPAADEDDVPPPARPARPKREPGAGAARSKQRLKDMLGFGDPPAPTPEPRTSLPAASAPVVATPPPAAPPTPAAPPAPPAVSPSASGPSAPESPAAPPAPGRPASSRDIAFEFDFSGDVPEPAPVRAPADPAPRADDPLPPATLREMLEGEVSPRPRAPSRAARELLSMAAMVEHLGVPPQRRAVVRAVLVDLGRQMETPPVHWWAIRQAMEFMMDYPLIARRVIPLLPPYLDEAA